MKRSLVVNDITRSLRLMYTAIDVNLMVCVYQRLYGTSNFDPLSTSNPLFILGEAKCELPSCVLGEDLLRLASILAQLHVREQCMCAGLGCTYTVYQPCCLSGMGPSCRVFTHNCLLRLPSTLHNFMPP